MDSKVDPVTTVTGMVGFHELALIEIIDRLDSQGVIRLPEIVESLRSYSQGPSPGSNAISASLERFLHALARKRAGRGDHVR